MAIAVITSFFQLSDNNGDPLNAGTVTVQAAGTTTPLSCFSDTGLSVSATNPIPLNSAGRHSLASGMVYIAAAAYKIIIKNAAGTTLYTLDNIDPGVPIGSGALAIVNGGTGATSAAAALAALGAATAAEVAALAAQVAGLAGAAASSEKTHIAVGTTAQRPSVPVEGDIRRNTTTTKWEGYVAAWWNFFTSQDVATQAQQQTGTSITEVVTPGRQHFHEGSCKAWGYVTWSAGVPTLQDSYGIASINGDSAGDITFTLSATMANALFSVNATPNHSSFAVARETGKTTTTFSVKIVDIAGTDLDPVGLNVQVFGTLA